MFSDVGLEPCADVAEPETGRDPSVLPRDVAALNFQSDEDIRSTMLTKSDIATVISSYEKTIGTYAISVLWLNSIRTQTDSEQLCINALQKLSRQQQYTAVGSIIAAHLCRAAPSRAGFYLNSHSVFTKARSWPRVKFGHFWCTGAGFPKVIPKCKRLGTVGAEFFLCIRDAFPVAQVTS